MMRFAWIWLICGNLYSQNIEFIRSYYADEASEWNFFHQKENMGSLRARWAHEGNFSEWDIRLGEFSGSIKIRWKEKPNEWELRLGNDFLTLNPVWPNYFDKWRIDYLGKNYYIELQEDLEGLSWTLKKDGEESLVIYNEFMNSYLDWVLQPLSKTSNPLPLQLALCFVATFYSTPK